MTNEDICPICEGTGNIVVGYQPGVDGLPEIEERKCVCVLAKKEQEAGESASDLERGN